MAVLTLAIGIGATTAVFSVVNSVLLKPLRYPDADELVASGTTRPARRASPTFGRLADVAVDVLHVFRRKPAFEQVGLWTAGTANVTGIERRSK